MYWIFFVSFVSLWFKIFFRSSVLRSLASGTLASGALYAFVVRNVADYTTGSLSAARTHSISTAMVAPAKAVMSPTS